MLFSLITAADNCKFAVIQWLWRTGKRLEYSTDKRYATITCGLLKDENLFSKHENFYNNFDVTKEKTKIVLFIFALLLKQPEPK